MNATKVIYVGVLTALLILAGCFGSGVIDDGEGQSTDPGNEGTTTTDNTGSTSNSAPYIDARLTSMMMEGYGMALAEPIWETPLDQLDEDEEPVLDW